MAGIGGFLVLSVVFSLAVAAILGQVGRDVSKLLEGEAWTDAPLARGAVEVEAARTAPTERAAAHRSGWTLRREARTTYYADTRHWG